MKTWSRDAFLEGREQWQDFGWEWEWVKRLSTEWSPYPPSGTKHDDRDAENPSVRAIVYRAMHDNPTELRRILGRVKSWNGVVASIIGLETRLRLDADDLERDVAFDRKAQPDHVESAQALAAILRRISDSA